MPSHARRGALVRFSPYGSRKTLALPKTRESRSGERVFVHSGFEGLKILIGAWVKLLRRRSV